MCLNDQTIEVNDCAVEGLIAQGATLGGCDERCCPDTPTVEGKIDMCLNGNTINVNRNACEGIMQAGGTCGACPVVLDDPETESEPESETGPETEPETEPEV